MLLQHDLTVLGQNGSILPVEFADMKFKMENGALFGKLVLIGALLDWKREKTKMEPILSVGK